MRENAIDDHVGGCPSTVVVLALFAAAEHLADDIWRSHFADAFAQLVVTWMDHDGRIKLVAHFRSGN